MAKGEETFTQAPLNAGSRSLGRDPAEIYEANERRSCAGCDHIMRIEILGENKLACDQPRKRYGRRCELYVERKPERR